MDASLTATYLKSAFLAMEPANHIISLARQFGGGSISTEVQLFILEHCVNSTVHINSGWNHKYIRNTLKKLIAAAESSCDEVFEGLYEQFTYYMTLRLEDDLLKDSRASKQISFVSLDGQDNISHSAVNLAVQLQCSVNMLEGDTGCALWPSSLFLSEFILSHADTFAGKFCFEVGSGVGLVGITLSHVGASKVILTDGDISTLANLKENLELNQLNTEAEPSQTTSGCPNLVECIHMPWESASEVELQNYHPNIVLGADIIYDPRCVPHLIRVLSILLNPVKSCLPNDVSEGASVAPIAYIATVIRNPETFDCFLRLSEEACLSLSDITNTSNTLNLLPYMLSYDRSSVRLYKVSSSHS